MRLRIRGVSLEFGDSICLMDITPSWVLNVILRFPWKVLVSNPLWYLACWSFPGSILGCANTLQEIIIRGKGK